MVGIVSVLSFCFVALVYLISHWFKREQFSIMIGMSESLGMLLVFFGQYWMSNILAVISWRVVIEFQSFVTLFFALCYGFIIRNQPSEYQF